MDNLEFVAIENIRRVGGVTKLMTDAGLILIKLFILPFCSGRQMVRDIMEPGEFFEVFIAMPRSVAEERDIEGLYAKVRASGQQKTLLGLTAHMRLLKPQKFISIQLQEIFLRVQGYF